VPSQHLVLAQVRACDVHHPMLDLQRSDLLLTEGLFQQRSAQANLSIPIRSEHHNRVLPRPRSAQGSRQDWSHHGDTKARHQSPPTMRMCTSSPASQRSRPLPLGQPNLPKVDLSLPCSSPCPEEKFLRQASRSHNLQGERRSR